MQAQKQGQTPSTAATATLLRTGTENPALRPTPAAKRVSPRLKVGLLATMTAATLALGVASCGKKDWVIYTTPEHKDSVHVSALPKDVHTREAWQGWDRAGVYYWPGYHAGPYYCNSYETFAHDNTEIESAAHSGKPIRAEPDSMALSGRPVPRVPKAVSTKTVIGVPSWTPNVIVGTAVLGTALAAPIVLMSISLFLRIKKKLKKARPEEAEPQPDQTRSPPPPPEI